MGEFRLALRFARRELRGGLRGFRLFLACLTLGVMAIAAVESLAAALAGGLAREGQVLLGGDIEARLIHRPARADEAAALAALGTRSQTAELRAMASDAAGDAHSLVTLKAVDGAYPLYGEVGLAPPQSVAAALARRNGLYGAVADAALLSRLGIKLGERLRVGDAVYELRAVLTEEPDRLSRGLSLGPPLLVALDSLPATGLIQPGSLVEYRYRVRLPPSADAETIAARLDAAFPEAGWQLRTRTNAAPQIERFVARLGLFLSLIALSALVVGGIGIANAVRAYLASKTATIATLKALGAPSRVIFLSYLLLVAALSALGIAIGLVLGALVPPLLAGLLGAALPLPLAPGPHPGPLVLAAIDGLLVALGFALWPLARARDLPPSALFRDPVMPLHRRPPLRYAVAAGSALLALAILALATAPDRRLAVWFLLGMAASLAVLRLAGGTVVALARRLPHPRRPGLRLALANLHRPGALSVTVIVSLGLGLTLLVALTLIEANLSRQLQARPAVAPSFFFVDIQPQQIERFTRIVEATPGARLLERAPALRGRITALGGVPVARAKVAAEAEWALRSDRGLTYAATPPPGSKIVAGRWWPADYAGPPLVSFDADLAAGMGLAVGDSITVNVLGRDVTARIANLRRIDWTAMGLDFVFVFAPGLLDGAPHSYIATARAETPAAEEALFRAVTDAFANVTAIRVRDAIETVSGLLDALGAAMRAAGLLTLAAGVLVLAGAMAAGHRRRVYEAVLLKVLGATRGRILRIYLLEYALLGLAAAAIAALAGSLIAYATVIRLMELDWVFVPGAVVASGLLALLLTLALGLLGTWRALGHRAAAVLRAE